MSQNEIITGTFLDRLRNTTALSHKNLENLPVSLSIISPAVTRLEYTHYLMLMHDVIKDVEENIFPAINGLLPDMPSRKKAELLENDLEFLGITKSGYKKILTSNSAIPSQAFAMGILYVIEGSTLGGRYILKNINEVLGLDGQKGALYFAGYGNATGSRWKNFLNCLTAYENENGNDSEIIEGATFAFERISAHFTTNTPQ